MAQEPQEPIKMGNNGDEKFVFSNPQKLSIRQALQTIFDAIVSWTNAIERLEKKVEELRREIK